MKKIYILLLLGLFISSSYAQRNPKIDKKTYFLEQDGVVEAKKSFKKAEKYYKRGVGTFDEALKYYRRLYKYNSNSEPLNYKMGVCYLYTADKKLSLPHLLNSSPATAKDYFLVLGRSYQYNFKFAEAKESYIKYLESLPKWKQKDAKKHIDQLIAECNVSKELIKDSSDVFIINLGPIINTYYDEYNAILPLSDTNIYFTSTRPEVEPMKRVSRFSFKEKILMTENCIGKRVGSNAYDLDGIVSSKNRAVSSFSSTEKKIYFYRGKKHSGSIYSATLKNGKWKQRKRIKGDVNNIASKETSISFTKNGTAFFVSNRRKGQGGKDIWKSIPNKRGRYQKAQNLGDIINTPFDEEGIYVTDDGNTIYFSSNGHLGMGGYDVYKSHMGLDGKWTQPKNLGHPINSAADELFYKPTADTMVALYSTIRKDSYGGLDIYKIQKDPRVPFKLIGAVTDIESGEPINATVRVYDKKTEQLIKTTKVDSLEKVYTLNFEDVGDFSIEVTCEKYKSVIAKAELPTTKRETVVQDFQLEMLRHPFTLIGKVTDVDKKTPIQATLKFKDAASNNQIARTVSSSIDGKYSITFDDKYDMVLDVEATNYFSTNEAINTTNETSKVISKNIELKRSKIDFVLTGAVTQDDGKTPVKAILSFFKPNELKPFTVVESDSIYGKYKASFDTQGPFMIEVFAENYFFLNEIYKFPDEQTFTAKNFSLKKMESGVKFVVENILFNTGKSTLKPESFPELNKLANLLIKNPGIRIEVSGHTDNTGSASLNKKLSKSRALTVKNYLVSTGILDERIEFAGYGYEQPIASNDTKEGRAINRRVEVKILD